MNEIKQSRHLLSVLSATPKGDFASSLLIFILSFVIHYWKIMHPNSIIFDEVTFGQFISSWIRGEYYFDLHPPLGKLILSGIYSIAHGNPNYPFLSIGDVYFDHAYFWMRSVTALCGTLLPISTFYLMRGLKFQPLTCLTASLFIIFDNSLLVISRTYVLDIFLIFFGFSSLAFAVWAKLKNSAPLRYLAWFFATLSFSIKWSGLSFIGLLIILELLNANESKKYFKTFQMIFGGLICSALLYFAFFTIHLKGMHHTGMGDAFMSAEFRATLNGSPFQDIPGVKKPNLLSKFLELNRTMFQYQNTMKNQDPYSSKWNTWPWLTRPIYFWFHRDSSIQQSRIYLLGNPFFWWTSTIAVFFLTIELMGKLKLKLILTNFSNINSSTKSDLLLWLTYGANYFPFIFIDRTLFIYHYLAALTAAYLILARQFEKIESKKPGIIFVLLGILTFLYFAPISYGLPLTHEEYMNRVWFRNWL